MEREVVSFKKFKEILNNIGLNAYETERFVDAFVDAVENYENAHVYCKNKPGSMTVTQCEETVDCDISYKDGHIEVALKQPVLEEVTKEILMERLIENGHTPTEAEILWKLM